MPTTSRTYPGRKVSVSRLPKAFSPGQNRLAIDELINATGSLPARSASLKSRPAKIGMRIALMESCTDETNIHFRLLRHRNNRLPLDGDGLMRARIIERKSSNHSGSLEPGRLRTRCSTSRKKPTSWTGAGNLD